MRRRTIWKQDHPVNKIHAHGQQTKEAVRKLSNMELDKLMLGIVGGTEGFDEVLDWPRHKKIEFAKTCAMRSFAKGLKEVKEAGKCTS